MESLDYKNSNIVGSTQIFSHFCQQFKKIGTNFVSTYSLVIHYKV